MSMKVHSIVLTNVISAVFAYYATNPGYVDLESAVCTSYGSVILESDDCKTSLDCKTWPKPKILNCMRSTDRTLKDYQCVYQYKSDRCNTTYTGK